MKKIVLGTLLLASISFAASAQTSKNTHGKTVSTVAKTNTKGTTDHGKTVSAVAKKDRTTVTYPKAKYRVHTKTHSDNRYKTKTVAVKAKGKKY
jgi:hypothetical protein